MNNKVKPDNMKLTPIEDLIAEDFGEPGTPQRDQFEMDCDAFVIGEQLKEERIKAGLTQEQLADRIGSRFGGILLTRTLGHILSLHPLTSKVL